MSFCHDNSTDSSYAFSGQPLITSFTWLLGVLPHQWGHVAILGDLSINGPTCLCWTGPFWHHQVLEVLLILNIAWLRTPEKGSSGHSALCFPVWVSHQSLCPWESRRHISSSSSGSADMSLFWFVNTSSWGGRWIWGHLLLITVSKGTLSASFFKVTLDGWRLPVQWCGRSHCHDLSAGPLISCHRALGCDNSLAPTILGLFWNTQTRKMSHLSPHSHDLVYSACTNIFGEM